MKFILVFCLLLIQSTAIAQFFNGIIEYTTIHEESDEEILDFFVEGLGYPKEEFTHYNEVYYFCQDTLIVVTEGLLKIRKGVIVQIGEKYFIYF